MEMHGGYSRQDGKAGPTFQAAGWKARLVFPCRMERTSSPTGRIDEAIFPAV